MKKDLRQRRETADDLSGGAHRLRRSPDFELRVPLLSAPAVTVAVPWFIALALPVGIVLGYAFSSAWPFVAMAALGAGLFGWSRATAFDRRPLTELPARVRRGKLIVPGARHVEERSARAVSGYHEPSPRGERVFLLDAHGGCVAEFVMADEREATRLLAALGFDAPQQRATFRAPVGALDSSQRLVAGGVSLAGVGLTALVGSVVGSSALFLLVPALLALRVAASPTTLEIGADGLTLVRFGRRRFIRFADVADITAHRRGLRVALSDGAHVVVATTALGLFGRSHRTRRDAILARARRALDAYRRNEPSAAVELVSRAGRPLDAWLEALTRGARPGYRKAAAGADELWRIVEDAAAEASARAAAAWVIARGGLEKRDKRRLRIAARATASPRLRVALDVLTQGGEQEAVVGALRELAEEDERAVAERAAAARAAAATTAPH